MMPFTENMSQAPRIALVHQERAGFVGLTTTLEQGSMTVLEINNLQDLLESCSQNKVDLILLGTDGSDLDCLEMLREVREISAIPLIMLSARHCPNQYILSLELGADDYMSMPLGTREFLARLRSVLRRTWFGSMPRNRVDLGSLILDLRSRTVSKDGKALALTPAQFELLLAMAQEPGKVFQRNELIRRIGGYDYEGYERTVDTHIKNIRKAIEDNPSEPSLVLTVWGVGYKFNPPRSA